MVQIKGCLKGTVICQMKIYLRKQENWQVQLINKHHIFLKDCTVARLSSRKCQLKTKINQLCKEENFVPAIFRLKSAADQGYFSNEKVLERLIMSVAHKPIQKAHRVLDTGTV